MTMTLLCMAALLLCVAGSLAFGARIVAFSDVSDALLHSQRETINQLVVWERVPRTVFGLVAGVALGVSGAMMQAVTRNPVADPGVLGINTGAALFVVVGISFLSISTPAQFIWFALAGAGITTVFVFSIGSIGAGGATPIKLALAGAATSAALSSLISAVILPRADVLNVYRFWQVGGLSGATWQGIATVLPFIITGLLMAAFLSPSLEIMAMGDDLATGLGVKTRLMRLLGSTSGILLCAAVTALAGPISFVGLMIPHIMRGVTGAKLGQLFVLSAVGGAAILLCSDTLGRVIGRPGEVEAGIITAFVGAPVLILIARRGRFQLV